MKKRILAIIGIILAITIVFSSCGAGQSETTQNGEEISTTKNSKKDKTTTEAITEVELTTSKYSKEDKLIALTYDDGPGYESAKKIQQILKDNDSVATFFVVGTMLDEHPQITKQAFDNGNEIGNHSKDHKYLTKCTDAEIIDEIHSNNQKIKEITGEDCKVFRAPGGLTKGISDKVDMPIIGWSIDTNDWKKKDAAHKGRSEAERQAEIDNTVDMVLKYADKGQIVLMHEIYNFTADLTEALVPRLKAEGYKLVTISEMFEAYGIPLENGKIYHSATPKSPSGLGGKIEPGNYVVATSYDSLNIRAEANSSATILGEIPKGTEVTVTESVVDWAKVNYNGTVGWVSTKYLAKPNS